MFELKDIGADDRISRRAAPACAVVPARLLGAGQGRGRPDARTISSSFRGTTATISTAGRRCRAWRRACCCAASRRFAAGERPSATPGLIAAFGALIEDARAGRIDPAFAALALTLPSEADIAREIGEDVDPDAIYTARKALRGALGRKHGDALVELHGSFAEFRAVQSRRGRGRAAGAAQWRAGAVRRRQRDRRARARASTTQRSRQHDRAPRRPVGDRNEAELHARAHARTRSADAMRWSR